MIPVWLPVAVPWAGAALLAALPRWPALAGPGVAAASLLAAAALAAWGGAAPPGPLAVALLVAGAVSAFLAAVAGVGTTPPGGNERLVAAGFPLLQGAQALALLATDEAVAWIGLAVCAGTGAGLVALSGGRRGFAAASAMLMLCGAGLALALLGSAMLRAGGAAAPSGLSGVGFILLLLGFGALAGLAPMHAWLPRAVAASAPPVAAVLAGLLPPAALHALVRAAGTAAGAGGGGVSPPAVLAALGLLTALLAAWGAWRRSGRAAESPGWSGAGLAGSAALGFGLGGAAGNSAGVLLLVGLPFCVGAAVLGASAGGPVAAFGRAALAGMPPFAPFAALVLLFSAVAALPAAAALPLGAALLLSAAAQFGAAARTGRGGAPDRGAGLLAAAPAWVLLGLAFALGAALPEPVAGSLADAVGALR